MTLMREKAKTGRRTDLHVQKERMVTAHNTITARITNSLTPRGPCSYAYCSTSLIYCFHS